LEKILMGKVPFPSALLLEGPPGIGKRTLSREFFLNLYCRRETSHYCGECHSCKAIHSHTFPDIYRFPEEETIKIQQIREMKDYYVTPPVESNWKVVYIPSLENMTINASNSFLKMLEEPPSYLRIFATTNYAGQILPTILSRFMQIPLTTPSWSDFKAFCRDSLPHIPEKYYQLLFYMSHSSPAYALKISKEQGFLTIRDKCLEGLIQLSQKEEAGPLYNALNYAVEHNMERNFFPTILFLIRDLIYIQLNLKEFVVNRDIYDKIMSLDKEKNVSFLWDLADTFYEKLSVQKKFYDQFLWNEYLLWKIMKLRKSQ